MLKDFKYLDFKIIKEDWNKFTIEDGTELKIKIVMVKILRRKYEEGYDYRFNHNKIFYINAPLDKSGTPTDKRYSVKELRDSIIETDMKYKRSGKTKWNEYIINEDKTKIYVRPEIITIHKSKFFDEYGDPIYSIQIQPIFKSVPIKK
jgi:hypothetical protein